MKREIAIAFVAFVALVSIFLVINSRTKYSYTNTLHLGKVAIDGAGLEVLLKNNAMKYTKTNLN